LTTYGLVELVSIDWSYWLFSSASVMPS